MSPALNGIREERARQDAKWGKQRHPFDRPGSWWVGNSTHQAGERRCDEFGLQAGAGRFQYVCGLHHRRGDGSWWDILMEEVAEAIEASPDPVACRAELVQVAAVCVAMIEHLDETIAAQPVQP
jgi:hypothetical protein